MHSWNPRREQSRRNIEIFEEIIENFPKLMSDIKPQVQEA